MIIKSLLSSLILLLTLINAQSPQIALTLFNNLPSKLFYFDDTQVVIYHDEIAKDIYRSQDEGKTWQLIQGVPRGHSNIFIEHPFDSRVAFILTDGITHYRSLNRGADWASFQSPLPPVLNSNTLNFHSRKLDWIIFKGQRCESNGSWRGKLCHYETFISKDSFSTAPDPLLAYTSRCIFAHEKKEYAINVPDELIYCVASEPPPTSITTSKSDSPKDMLAALFASATSLRETRLYSSLDFFKKDHSFVDLGIGKEARGIVDIGVVQKYLVTALKPTTDGTSSEMAFYITEDGQTWSKAIFPHGNGLSENAYTIVKSTPHSILVDINSSPTSTSGTLFTSNSNGTYFVRSLENTNRNAAGLVDYEQLVSVEGIAIINVVGNPDGVIAGEKKALKTKITYDDGGRWYLLQAPQIDYEGKKVKCDTSDLMTCSLHLHSVTQPHNFGPIFSSTAPGLVMGVGSIGDRLLPYDDCDTFLSTDAGLSWRMIGEGARKYEFGDQGSLLIMIDDEDPTDQLSYSFDFGSTWKTVNLGVKLRARLLTTVPDSTSLSFVLLGTLTRTSEHQGSNGERHIIVHIDFESLKKRKCGDQDMERWYARTMGGEPDCLMGHKQWFLRRKADADCVISDKFKDPVGREENCSCSDEDYECDYNFVPDGDTCVPAGPEIIPKGSCKKETDTFKGSSGFRLIPGNSCDVKSGIHKDALVEKPCHAGQSTPGLISHSTFNFPGLVLDQVYFADSHTLLAFTSRNAVWQSSNEGLSWSESLPGKYIAAMTMHGYSNERAYLLTETRTVHYTTDRAASWNTFEAPDAPNSFGIPLLDFHPLRSDWLIWTGQRDCEEDGSTSRCRAVAQYTKDNGRNWNMIDEYVRICSWGRDKALKLDEKIIFCESYRDKSGTQRGVFSLDNPLQLIAGDVFYSNKRIVFPSIIGFATFEEYMVVAELYETTRAIGLKVSLNGKDFALARFPANIQLENQAYTVLQSTTDSVFLHVTTHAKAGSEWGSLFKSNSNGTYYSLSLEYANRDAKGFVDFEKMVGLEGIALMNVVSNPEEAALSGYKKLQTRITHNDGGRWKPINPPTRDALGNSYACQGTKCGLHIHGYTERTDSRATYSSPTAVGLMLAVGNVGESLVPYSDSDTFLTRDGGFNWEEVHKDAHIWEYGDQGSILLLANDEGVTDRVTYTLNEGLSWNEYVFGERIRVRSIVTVPMDTSRKFILFGINPDQSDASVAVHIDFSSISNVKCKLDLANPTTDDFELWSPSEEREEKCLFGQQTMYHRRIRDRTCYIGEKLVQPASIVKTCACMEDDFECEFNYRRNARGECVLVDGATPLESDSSTCTSSTPFWYTRTNFRKVRHSACEGGLLLDRGTQHACEGQYRRHGVFWWIMMILLPFLIAGLAAIWWSRRRGGKSIGGGRIRLPDHNGEGENQSRARQMGGNAVEVLASVPWFVIGVMGVFVGWVREVEIPWLSNRLRRSTRGGYRSVHLDDDAELLRDYDDDEEE